MGQASSGKQKVIDSVSQDRLWADTQALGAEYRASGSEAESKAVDYIVEELKSAGVEDIHVYELDAYVSYHKSASCTVLSPESREIAAVAQGYTHPTPPGGIELEVVMPGEHDGDLSDKAVLLARDWPNPPGAAKAAVQIHAQTTNELHLHRGGTTPIWGTATDDHKHLLALRNPAINISRPDGEELRDMIRQGSTRIRVTTDVETGWKRIRFPVARIPGREKTFVLTGGHLDSHEPGVTDNATGGASLLELARVFNQHRDQLRHGLVVGWWTGHESAGYAGSTWFNDHNWQDLHENCVLYWNNDGPGIREATNIESRYTFPQTQAFVIDLIREFFGKDPEIIAKPIKMGDQSFWGVGVPSAAVYRCLTPDHPDWAVVFGAGHGNWWHSTGDTLDKVDPEYLAEDTRFYATALYRLCTAETLPFEFETYGKWMEATLRELQDEAGERFDLSALVDQAEEISRLAGQLTNARDRASDSETREAVNETLMRLSRILNPAYLTAVGLFDQDLRGTIPGPVVRYPLPGEEPFQPGYFPVLQRARRLSSVEGDLTAFNTLYTTLLRERNRVSHAFKQAIGLLEQTLEIVGR